MAYQIGILVAAILLWILVGSMRTSKKNNNPLFQALEIYLMDIVIASGNSIGEEARPKIEAVLRKHDMSIMDVIHVTTMMDIQLARLAYSKAQIKTISDTILQIHGKRRN